MRGSGRGLWLSGYQNVLPKFVGGRLRVVWFGVSGAREDSFVTRFPKDLVAFCIEFTGYQMVFIAPTFMCVNGDGFDNIRVMEINIGFYRNNGHFFPNEVVTSYCV